MYSLLLASHWFLLRSLPFGDLGSSPVIFGEMVFLAMLFQCLFFFMVMGAEGMYGPLTDILHQADPQQIGVTIQYLPPGGSLPIALQHSDVWVNRFASVNAVIRELEHSGCSSGRLSALLAVVRHCSPEESLTTRPADLGPPESVPPPLPDVPTSSSPAAPAQRGPEAMGPGSALGAELAQLLLQPQVIEEATTSSPQLSPITDQDSDQLPPPSPNMLSQDEVAELRRLVVRIHVRREALRGIIPQDPEFQAISWLTTLRYVATAMGSFVPPPLPVPAGQVFADDLPGPHQVPASPAAGSVMASPSLVDSVDLALAADLERDLRELGEVED